MNTPKTPEVDELEAERSEVDELEEAEAEADEPEPEAGESLLMKDTEVALTLKISKRYVHSLVGMGLLDKVKLGPKVARITRSSVRNLAVQRATKASTAA